MRKKANFNRIGMKFGRLTVLEQFNVNHRIYCLCKCICGTVKKIDYGNLQKGHTKSCGCYMRETSKMNGLLSIKHEETKTEEYRIWVDIIQRCTNPKHISWKNYGGRGISIQPLWQHSYERFIEDMGYRPSKKHSLGRIDINKDYSKENCKWMTKSEVNSNRRNCIKHDGITMTQAAKLLGITRQALSYRIKRGMSLETAFSVKKRVNKYSPIVFK